jgi:hypothetical protein
MEPSDHDVGRLARLCPKLLRRRTGEVGDIEVAGWLKIALRGELLTLSGAHALGLLGAIVGAGEQYRQGPAQAINQKRAVVCFKCMPVRVRLPSHWLLPCVPPPAPCISIAVDSPALRTVAAQRYPHSRGQACEAHHTTLRQRQAKNFVEKRLANILPEPGSAVRGEAVLRDAGMTARDSWHADLVPLVGAVRRPRRLFLWHWLAIPLFLY